MQEPRRQSERPARARSFQELERERIYGEYAKAHPKDPPVIDDPDDERYFMDQDEIREFEQKKIAAEIGKTQQDRRKEVLEKIYSKNAPAPEPDEDEYDARPGVDRAAEAFWARHPEISEKDWAAMNQELFILESPDLVALRAKANETGNKQDIERLLERAVDVYEASKKKAEAKRYVEWLAKTRHPDDNAGLAKMESFMKGAR